jgi:CspA family cold shock protein
VAVGTISELSRGRGFGFLTDGAGRKRFFHRSAVVGIPFETLRENQRVQFEPKDDVKGLRAMNVRPAGAASGRGAGRGGAYDRGAGASRRTGSAGSSLDPRRSQTSRSTSGATTWRSSLSPFRGDPPPAAPRRRR